MRERFPRLFMLLVFGILTFVDWAIMIIFGLSLTVSLRWNLSDGWSAKAGSAR